MMFKRWIPCHYHWNPLIIIGSAILTQTSLSIQIYRSYYMNSYLFTFMIVGVIEKVSNLLQDGAIPEKVLEET